MGIFRSLFGRNGEATPEEKANPSPASKTPLPADQLTKADITSGVKDGDALKEWEKAVYNARQNSHMGKGK